MDADTGLLNFAEDIHQQVISRAHDTQTEGFEEDHFTDVILEYLAEAGEIDDWENCSHQARGIKVNGYNFFDDNESLDLFVTHYTGEKTPQKTSPSQIKNQIKKLYTYFQKGVNHEYRDLEESTPAFDLADKIFQYRETIRKIRLFVLTDYIVNIDEIEDRTENSYELSFHIWDIQRLFRTWNSGNKPEPIKIDFIKEFGCLIPCLSMPNVNDTYSAYLAIISGKTLAELYGKYGPRLLERNIRAFLQMRGSVNKGIRETLKNEPHMFLAYNNGISVAAENVELVFNPGEVPAIKAIDDFQIVNGAQTTASIYHSMIKDKLDVSNVSIPVKLTVIKNPGEIDQIVPKISEYANSQNKITAADFSSNEPFHIKIQKLSRLIWAPAKRGSQQQTHWYYERVRGQYLDDKSRGKTPKQRRTFENHNPTTQRFTKTDLAKYENTWNQLPFLVSLGAEKNFREFVQNMKDNGSFEPSDEYFRSLIGKAILFKKADKIILNQKYGGYKANIVTYTVALLSYLSQKRADLERIWKDQDITQNIENELINLSKIVQQHIIHPPGGKNITEWCKKKECWDSLLQLKVELSPKFAQEFVSDEFVKQREERIKEFREETQTEISEDKELIPRKDETITVYSDSDYEQTIKNFKPRNWFMLIRDVKKDGSFTTKEILLLQRMEKITGRNIRPQPDEISSVIEILEKIKQRSDIIRTGK
jgi:hypothetical protein